MRVAWYGLTIFFLVLTGVRLATGGLSLESESSLQLAFISFVVALVMSRE